MKSEKKSPDEPKEDSSARPKIERKSNPEWADGLRQLYDSVVEEPLPDSFKDLLSKLDNDTQGGG